MGEGGITSRQIEAIFSNFRHNDSRAIAIGRLEWHARAQFPMQDDPSNTYRSGASRKLLENAENADIEFSMAVLASAVHGLSRASVYACTWISGHTHEFRFLRVRVVGPARVCAGANQHRF